MTNDPLDDIFTNEQEVDPKMLAEILRPFVKINVESNAVIFTEEGFSLPVTHKVLLFLVVRKALKFRNKVDLEEVSPAEIISETGLKTGSVHPALKFLREKGLVMSKNGKYFLANYQLIKIKSMFCQGREKNDS